MGLVLTDLLVQTMVPQFLILNKTGLTPLRWVKLMDKISLCVKVVDLLGASDQTALVLSTT
ncbi:hypothetical protein D3C77_699820 [compost metagenome]